MVLKLELTAEGRKALTTLRRSADPVLLGGEVAKFFDRRAARIAGAISRDIGPGTIKRRTGNLARSIVGFGNVEGGRPGFEVGVLRGPALAYAGVQELGTKGKNPASPYPTIVPKRGKALAIPVGPALTPAGVARYLGPRSYPTPLHFEPILRGKVIGRLVTEHDETAYLLLRSVDIAPKHYLQTGVEKALPQLVLDLETFLVRLVDGGLPA